ncbi:MAG: hypothetical protein R6U55_09720 [Desulfovermiculus sp.]
MPIWPYSFPLKKSFGERSGKKDFDRDGAGVARSEAVLLVGLEKATPVGLNCGACGFAD